MAKLTAELARLAFDLPPERAVQFLSAKLPKATWNWDELVASAHRKAFTVAKLMQLDLLTTVHTELQRAQRQGIPLEEFKKTVGETLQRAGWWGKGTDPKTGQQVQLGNPWRLETIYRTNMQSSYQAGRMQQQRELSLRRPYWQYLAVGDVRTRPVHLRMNGIVLRADDPFWDTAYPPNGFGCRCKVRTLSDRQLEREGLTVTDSLTGPARLFRPDKGFTSAPTDPYSPDLKLYPKDLADAYRKGGALPPKPAPKPGPDTPSPGEELRLKLLRELATGERYDLDMLLSGAAEGKEHARIVLEALTRKVNTKLRMHGVDAKTLPPLVPGISSTPARASRSASGQRAGRESIKLPKPARTGADVRREITELVANAPMSGKEIQKAENRLFELDLMLKFESLSGERRDGIQANIQKLTEKIAASKGRPHADKSVREIIHERYFFKPEPAAFTTPRETHMRSTFPIIRHREAVAEGIDWVKRVVGRGRVDDCSVEFVSNGTRAFFRAEGGPGERSRNTICMESVQSPRTQRTTIHELGHMIEYRWPAAQKLAAEFLTRRTKGERPQPLSELTGRSHYRADEIAKKDRFFSPYIGKVYPSDYRFGFSPTEVISMGLEHLYDDPAKLIQDDPEMFDLLWNLVGNH